MTESIGLLFMCFSFSFVFFFHFLIHAKEIIVKQLFFFCQSANHNRNFIFALHSSNLLVHLPTHIVIDTPPDESILIRNRREKNRNSRDHGRWKLHEKSEYKLKFKYLYLIDKNKIYGIATDNNFPPSLLSATYMHILSLFSSPFFSSFFCHPYKCFLIEFNYTAFCIVSWVDNIALIYWWQWRDKWERESRENFTMQKTKDFNECMHGKRDLQYGKFLIEFFIFLEKDSSFIDYFDIHSFVMKFY